MVTEEARLRLQEFIVQATKIFMVAGYRRTKMSDVTRALGLSEGAIYRYFEGKEALFDLVVRTASRPDEPLPVDSLPAPNPEPAETLDFVRQCLDERTRFQSLETALSQDAPVGSARDEFEAIVREIFEATSRFRVSLVLVERCARDWPQLSDLWFDQFRRRLVEQLIEYFRRRGASGDLRQVPSPEAAAMVVLELASFFAIRYCDDWHFELDAGGAHAAYLDTLTNAFAPM